MNSANNQLAATFVRMLHITSVIFLIVLSNTAFALGTAVGTVIENTASITYQLSGAPLSLQSNTTTVVVAERINVVTTLQSAQTLVSPGDTGRALLFTVTNTGNGTETFLLAMDSSLAGDNFDPSPAAPAIYFDTDGSGDFNAPDQAYTQGVNDPDLAPDQSVDIFLVNDIPGTVVNGELGLSQLTATSATGSGVPGTVFANQGDGGVNAVAGATGGSAAVAGEYLVSDVLINVTKVQSVTDPFGGNEPVPGATLTYTITVEVASAGTATASVLRDAIPALSSYLANSITLNGAALSDAVDADSGELDSNGATTVVVRLGDITQADGPQTVVFQVTID